ncbi:MAG: DsrE family protein [Luteibacter sp.]|uniref:DsrE family protein n=1 Tax=Luteibacter sp. TaxID=1886636 RepID=UPI002808B22F|nr:DsrE family protein [Luteibacter sp.]MDQ7995254.1 DsrE family protein [Luteibacter sp.]
MRPLFHALLAGVFALSAGAASALERGYTPSSHPVITSAGHTEAAPRVTHLPDPHAEYRIVFSLSSASNSPSEINPGLDRVARSVNLYTDAGVPLNHLHVVAIVYGGATDLVLDQTHYREKLHADNPNLAVIDELRKAGVEVSVCSQAIAGHHYSFGWVDPRVTVSLSGLTTVTALQAQGYAFMPL